MSRFTPSLAAVLLCFVLCAGPASANARPVGRIVEVEGTANLSHKGGAAAKVKTGDAVSRDDTIATDENSRVRILFDDKTEFTLANKGKLVIDDFVYDPNRPSQSKARLSLFGAAFHYLGGLIDRGDVKINLDYGSIGIRGTDVYRAMRHNECWIYVKSGSISVSNQGGAVKLADGQGTRMSARDKAPAAAHNWSGKEIDWIVGETANPWTHHKDWK